MKEIVSKTALFLLTLFVLVPLLLLWQGWAMSTLWGWFVVPLGLPIISVAEAAGLCLVASVLRMRRTGNSSSDRFEAIAGSIIFPLVSVVIGWIIKTFA